MQGPPSIACYSDFVKARVIDGRIVVEGPTDLPEGTEWDLILYDRAGDSLRDEDRTALHRSLLRGVEQADAGLLTDADTVLAELDS